MYKVPYNPETGEIGGFYDTGLNYPSGIPTPNIEVTPAQHSEAIQKINQEGKTAKVVEGELIFLDPPEPTIEEIQAQELAKLNAEFEPQFKANDEAYLLALRNNDQELIEELNEEKADLVAEYTKRKEVIFNGN